MNHWITSAKRKIHQRKLNALIRKINKFFEKDELWQGRFYIRQKEAFFGPYCDGSGADLYVVLELRDRKTGLTKLIAESANHFIIFNGWNIITTLNDFIIYTCEVWKEDPYKDKYNWKIDKDKRSKI